MFTIAGNLADTCVYKKKISIYSPWQQTCERIDMAIFFISLVACVILNIAGYQLLSFQIGIIPAVHSFVVVFNINALIRKWLSESR